MHTPVSSNWLRRIASTVAAIALLPGVASAQAPASYTATASGSPLNCGATNASGPVSAGPCDLWGGCAGQNFPFAKSSAMAGLAMWASVDQTIPNYGNSCGGGWRGGGTASKSFSSFAAGTGTTVLATMSLDFEGTWSIDRPNTPAGGGATMVISGSAGGYPAITNNGSGSVTIGGGWQDGGNFSYNIGSQTGPYTSNLIVSNVIVLPMSESSVRISGTLSFTFAIPLNYWFDTGMSFQNYMHNGDVGASGPCYVGTSCSRTLRHSGSVRFANLAFDVPPGILVNAPSANVVNNHFAAPPPPTVSISGGNVGLCPGATATFAATATGAGPFLFQWKKAGVDLVDGATGSGSTISGATSSTLSIANTSAADYANYTVVVTSPFGSFESDPATLIGGCVINITAATQQAFLDSLTTPASSIVMQNVPDRPTLTLSALTNLGGTMQLTGNTGLTTLTANLLATVGGRVDIRNNPLLTDVTLPALTTVTGDVDVSGNAAATGIDFPMLGGVGGSVTVTENPNAAAVNFPTLGGIGGSVAITENPNAAAVNFPLLGGVGGSVTVTENPNAATINFPILGGVGGSVTVTENPNTTSVNLLSLATVVGSVSIRDNLALAAVSMPLLTDVDGGVEVSGNTSATTIDFASLGSSGGAVTVTNNPGASTIDFASLGSSGGAVTVTNNPGASTIDFASLGSSGGAVTIRNNPGTTNIALDSLTTVGGDLTLETQGQADVDLSGAAVAGSTDINSTDANTVEVQTPGGTTSIEMCNGAVCMDADLPDNATPDGTPFAVLHVSGPALDPQAGLDASGQPATVDPVAAYTFTLGAPLQGPASLVFELTLAALTPPEQAAVLDAYAAGSLTLTVQGDNPGDLPTARAQCGPSDPLVPDGCVLIGAFDVLGFQLPPGQTAGAEKLRFAALVSHFSTYSIAIIGAPCPPDFNNSGGVGVQDIFDFLAAYFTSDPRADFNDSGAISVQDIFDFLAAYFAGCA